MSEESGISIVWDKGGNFFASWTQEDKNNGFFRYHAETVAYFIKGSCVHLVYNNGVLELMSLKGESQSLSF